MGTIERKEPKDEHITNKDDSVTNKDGDNYLEKGKQPVSKDKTGEERTTAPGNENGDTGPPDKTKESDKERLKHTM